MNNEIEFSSKLRGARSRLYRRRFLQVNTRWKALDEIYKIYMLLNHSDLNISEKNRQTFSHFSAKFAKNDLTIVIFEFFSVISAQILMKFCRNFADILENVQNVENLNFRIFLFL